MTENQSALKRDASTPTMQNPLNAYVESVVRRPHDALFEALLSNPVHAQALMRKCLPDRITSKLADKAPEILDSSHIGKDLRSTGSDILLKSELASSEGTGYVITVCKHESYPDRNLMP